jgi:hypothetical protein
MGSGSHCTQYVNFGLMTVLEIFCVVRNTCIYFQVFVRTTFSCFSGFICTTLSMLFEIVFHHILAGPSVTHKNQTEYHQLIFQTCS